MTSPGKVRSRLIGDLKNAKFVVKGFGNYGRGVDARDVAYGWNGHLKLAGTIVTTPRAVVLLSYQSPRTEEMNDVARLHCEVLPENDPRYAVENYLERLRRASA
ncbi:MAG: hypothetical protein HY517_01010 [Candidatus Aenigmarchaeota archaeon]|nr:hypothetical protein [Candidatus Aenigmarchaeota archaeon]